MAKWQPGEWGIDYVVSVAEGGYEWIELPEVVLRGSGGTDRSQTVLVRTGDWKHSTTPGANETWTLSGPSRGTIHTTNKATARRAFNEFKKLAEVLCATESCTWQMNPHQPGGWITADVAYGRREQEASKGLIRSFANKYGRLWVNDKECTISAWVKESEHFLDLFELSTSIRTNRYSRFEKRVSDSNDGWGVNWYGRNNHMYRIAIPGEWHDREGVTIDRYEEMKRASSQMIAQAAFAREVNRTLAGGFDIRLSRDDLAVAGLVPKSLIYLLYAIMWRDTVRHDTRVRERTCDECGDLLPADATRRRRFCDDACRTSFNNRSRTSK